MFEVIVITLIKVSVVMMAILTGCAYSTWLERKVLARMQNRLGPTYAGPFGLLQPVADGLKVIFKEDLVPKNAEKTMFALAPIVTFIPAILTFAVVPFGADQILFGHEVKMVISDLNIGVLWIFAITSLGIYGIILAGWSSGSKYSLMGGLRASAQMISYEVSYGLSIIGVIILANTLSLTEIINQQGSDSFWFFENWFIWKQPLGFFLYLVCAIAETNRAPFDMAEAESELVAGYHTEYSSMRFSMFFIAEYANMIAVSSVGAVLFFGGWQGPVLPSILWFLIKVFLFMFFYIWLRATFPRFRYDQLMSFGWKVLFPLALFNTMATAAFKMIK